MIITICTEEGTPVTREYHIPPGARSGLLVLDLEDPTSQKMYLSDRGDWALEDHIDSNLRGLVTPTREISRR